MEHEDGQSAGEPGILALDDATLADLGVFPTAPAAEARPTSLFAWCERTRTRGGAEALRRRMRRPFSDPARIRSTQAALAHLAAHRSTVDALPSAYVLDRLARYLGAPVVRVTQTGRLEFALAAFGLWMNDFRQYSTIAHGVAMTQRALASLRAFADAPALAAPPGELATLLEALRAALADPAIDAVSRTPARGRYWQVLRDDQHLRGDGRRALERLVALVHELDALAALADTQTAEGLTTPEIVDGPLAVHAEGLVHPLVPDAVANPVDLDGDHRLLFLTGPNMAGKTTYLRAVATAVYLAQLGMGVPARRVRLAPADALFSAIALQDDLHGGISYFRAEALRVKAVARAVADGRRVLAVLDEPFKGTNVKDALDASAALLGRFAACATGRFLVSSHLIELEDVLAGLDTVDCRHFEADESDATLHFDYRLRDGVSGQRLGMRVLAEEGVFALLDGAGSTDD